MAKGKGRRSPKLPGIAPADKEIEDAGAALADASAELSASHEKREDAARAVIEVMKRKHLTVYTLEEYTPPMTITLKAPDPSACKVQIKKASVVDEDGGGDE